LVVGYLVKSKGFVEQMGKVSAGVKCSVTGCNEHAVKSVSLNRARSAGLEVPEGRRAYLCKVHYKELKKRLKKERVIEKWRHTV